MKEGERAKKRARNRIERARVGALERFMSMRDKQRESEENVK
jgi:hypothetical protein